MNPKSFNDYIAKRFTQSEIDWILHDAEFDYQQTKEAKMFGKKTYLQQLTDYCYFRGIKFRLEYDYLKHKWSGKWFRESDSSWIGGTEARTAEDVCEALLKCLNLSWTPSQTPKPSTPHEDALKAYCAENSYIFSFWDRGLKSGYVSVSNGIKIPTIGFSNLQEWQSGSFVGSKEDACAHLFIGLKLSEKDKSKKELQEFCEQNGLTLSNEVTSRIKITSDDGPRALYFENYGIALHDLRLAKKARDLFWRAGPYESRVRELCEQKGWTLRCPGEGDLNHWYIDIRELTMAGADVVLSHRKGESGFKEVWENIQKLKALLE
jgi:hypothetical protein